MDSRDKIIEELRGVIAKLEAQLADQAARIRELELELAKAKKNSHTSSKPPSSDLTKPKPKQMTTEGLARSMLTHRERFLELVRQPPATKEAENLAARFAVVWYQVEGTSELKLYDHSDDYFRFMFAEGVEPTNNHSEQQIRHCVIDRKIMQGTRGEAGQRYHERMWTAIATCKKQNRNFFRFLYASIDAKLNNTTAPKLLGT